MRFEFGQNWQGFIRHLTDERIREAERSLIGALKVDSLKGKRFLDIGSGSGLFSLAARRLGARVFSFDYDPNSVAATAALREKFFPGDGQWHVERGDAVDGQYMDSLGQFDLVYSWGVLHHTGSMWKAMENACRRVAPGGTLVISIYNDQGRKSRIWKRIKEVYNWMPRLLRPLMSVGFLVYTDIPLIARHLVTLSPGGYIRHWTEYPKRRGMSRWHDVVDWVGGLPFEVATPDQIFDFCRDRGLMLTGLKTVGGSGACNEFVFVRPGPGGQT